MAIGQAETDALFELTVKPLLRSLDIIPRRVDQVQSNRDIDELIFEEIDKSDFILSDLTFARPSVYYEAGYARGKGKKVIYTCKHDHFRPRADDEYGNFRIHFDVLMKNTIPWNGVEDLRFAKRLRSRLARTLNPLRVQMARAAQNTRARDAFAVLPFKEKTKSIIEIFNGECLKNHFLPVDIGGPGFHSYGGKIRFYTNDSAINTYDLLHPGSFAARSVKNILTAYYLVVLPSVTTQFLRHLTFGLMRHPLVDLLPVSASTAKAPKIHERIIICTMKKSSFAGRDANMPHYSISGNGLGARWESHFEAPRGKFSNVSHLFANSDWVKKFVGVPLDVDKHPVMFSVDKTGGISVDTKRIGQVSLIERTVDLLLVPSVTSAPEIQSAFAETFESEMRVSK